MPTYSFECNKCKKTFDVFVTMSKRDDALKEPCELCGEKGGVQRIYEGAPNMTIDYNHRIDRPHNVGGFRDAIQRVCESPTLDRASKARLSAKHLT